MMATNQKKKPTTGYAARTGVSSDKTMLEIKHTLNKYGATGFGYYEMGGQVGIVFEMNQRRVRLLLPLPMPPTEQEVRQRWRALLLIVKAKLEAIRLKATTFEQEFLVNFVLPDGRTVGDKLLPEVESLLKDGKMPPLLLVSGN